MTAPVDASLHLADLGMDEVRGHELEIVAYALQALADVPGLTAYGPSDPALRGGAVAFSLEGVHPHDIATILDEPAPLELARRIHTLSDGNPLFAEELLAAAPVDGNGLTVPPKLARSGDRPERLT